MKLDIKTAHPLLTVTEVTELLRLTRGKVYDLIKSGEIDGQKICSRWKIKKYSVEKYILPPEKRA